MINVNMTDKAGVTLATAGKYCADNVKVTPSADILRKDEQAKTATPTTSAQDITPDAGKALSKVTVNPITAAIVGDLDADSFASSIVAAIEGKGVTVPDGTLLDGMAALIESIEAGGGGAEVSTGSFILNSSFIIYDSDGYVISHGLSDSPDIFVLLKRDETFNAGVLALYVYYKNMTSGHAAYSGMGSNGYTYLLYDPANITKETVTIISSKSNVSELLDGKEYIWVAVRGVS